MWTYIYSSAHLLSIVQYVVRYFFFSVNLICQIVLRTVTWAQNAVWLELFSKSESMSANLNGTMLSRTSATLVVFLMPLYFRQTTVGLQWTNEIRILNEYFCVQGFLSFRGIYIEYFTAFVSSLQVCECLNDLCQKVLNLVWLRLLTAAAYSHFGAWNLPPIDEKRFLNVWRKL